MPLALAPGGHAVNNGARLRLKYIAPRADGDRFFWGLNWEFGYFSRRSDSPWGMELRPIVGWRDAGWLVAFNPILGIDLTAQGSRIPRFEPALKLAREVRGGLAAGIKLYGDLGPIHHRRPGAEHSHSCTASSTSSSRGSTSTLASAAATATPATPGWSRRSSRCRSSAPSRPASSRSAGRAAARRARRRARADQSCSQIFPLKRPTFIVSMTR